MIKYFNCIEIPFWDLAEDLNIAKNQINFTFELDLHFVEGGHFVTLFLSKEYAAVISLILWNTD